MVGRGRLGAARRSRFRRRLREQHLLPAPGQIILYPGGVSETEILIAYGNVNFASKAGQLSGNHFITLTTGLENIYTLGRKVLWEGAQDIRFEAL